MEKAIIGGSGRKHYGVLVLREQTVQLHARPWGFSFEFPLELQLIENVSMLNLEGKLLFRFSGLGITTHYFGHAQTDRRPLVSAGGSFKAYVDVDDRTLHAYEAARLQRGDEDVSAELVLLPLFIQHSEIIRQPEECRFPLHFPGSNWARLLRLAGYSTVALHRLPPPSVPPDALERGRAVIDRFRSAERLLLEGRPDEAAQQCRMILDLFVQVYGIGSQFDQNVIDKMLGTFMQDGEKRRRLKLLFTQFGAVIQAPNHAELGSRYDVTEAQLLLSFTALTLEFFAGRLVLPGA